MLTADIYWEHIDIAPRDGTPVLVGRASTNKGQHLTQDTMPNYLKIARWEKGDWVTLGDEVSDPVELTFEPEFWAHLPDMPGVCV